MAGTTKNYIKKKKKENLPNDSAILHLHAQIRTAILRGGGRT